MIDTKALRSRVLDLAIQGKLTEQLESDGTAEELWQQIQAEKQRLIKEGKIKKEKPLPEITPDEIPFEIPENWKWVQLADIGSTNIGLTYHPADVSETGTIVIRSSNIVNGKIDYADIVKVNCAIKDNQYLNQNDIVICARNGSKALVGKNAIYTGDSGTVAFGAFMAVFRTSLFQYVHLYFNTDAFRRYFSGDDSKQINQVTQAILKESMLPLPPLAEQKRIVARVEEIFRLLDIIDAAQEQYAADAESLKAKLITLGIQGRLTEQLESDGTAEELYQQIQEEKQRLIKEGKIKKEKPLPEISDDEIPFEIPENWKWVRLVDILSKLTDGSHNPPPNSGLGYPVISAKNIKNGEITLDNVDRFTDEIGYMKENARTNIQKNDVILGIIGGSIGKLALYTRDEKVIAQRSIAIMSFMTNTQFALAFLKSPFFQNKLQIEASGSAQGGIYLGTLSRFLFPLPPLAEQKRIAETLERVLGVL